jgi:hypothetical protein
MICLLAATVGLGVGYSLQAPSVGISAQAPRVVAQRLEDQVDQSYANHDLNQVLGFFDSSYVLTDERGKRQTFVEFRKELEKTFSRVRKMNSGTVVDDVQSEAGRMVVHWKGEMRYEANYEADNVHYGWVPMISKESGEDTWERKGGQWKLVRQTIDRADKQFDPSWVKARADMEKAREKARADIASGWAHIPREVDPPCPCR